MLWQKIQVTVFAMDLSIIDRRPKIQKTEIGQSVILQLAVLWIKRLMANLLKALRRNRMIVVEIPYLS